jgi:hypothetical protein
VSAANNSALSSFSVWNFVGAPEIPEEALIELPPGFGARSRRITGTWWERRVEVAERPARPEPITIALLAAMRLGWNSDLNRAMVAMVMEKMLRNSMYLVHSCSGDFGEYFKLWLNILERGGVMNG